MVFRVIETTLMFKLRPQGALPISFITGTTAIIYILDTFRPSGSAVEFAWLFGASPV
jgi:hypothetical protein